MFQKLGVSVFPSRPQKHQLQQSMASRGEEWGGDVNPVPSRLQDLGEHRKLPYRGHAVEPQLQIILGRFMCNFVRFHASFSAFNNCLEMRDSYIHLPASRFDVPL